MWGFLCAETEMAEVSNEVVQLEPKLADIIICPVCCGLLNNAKLIPCGHSYCLTCLEDLTSEHGVGEADQLACPRCKRAFNVPTGGVACLPQNYYIDELVRLKEMTTSDRSGSGDERSLTAGDGQAGEPPSASDKSPRAQSPVLYSSETSTEGACSAVPEPDSTDSVAATVDSSRATGLDKPDDSPYPFLEPTDTTDSVVATVYSPRTTGSSKPKSPSMGSIAKRCGEHKDREMTIFCVDCEQPMCEKCFILSHNGHRHTDVDAVVGELRDKLREDFEKMDFVAMSDMANLRALEEQRETLLANVQASVLANTSQKVFYLQKTNCFQNLYFSVTFVRYF